MGNTGEKIQANVNLSESDLNSFCCENEWLVLGSNEYSRT